MRACRVLPVACGQAGQPGAVWNFWPVDQAARARACRARLCCGNSCRFAPLAFLICNLMSAIAQGSVRRHTRCSQHGCWRSRWAESHVAHFEGARRAARRIQTTYSRIGSGCRSAEKGSGSKKRLEEAFTLRGRRGLGFLLLQLASLLLSRRIRKFVENMRLFFQRSIRCVERLRHFGLCGCICCCPSCLQALRYLTYALGYFCRGHR